MPARPTAPAVTSLPDLSPPPARGTFSSLRTRNFRLFATGQVVSNTGAWVQRIAQDWLVLSLSGSTTAVGIATALQFLPTLLFGLAGGAIADRFPKRRILLATQLCSAGTAATLAALTLSGTVRVWHVYLVAFAFGLVTAVDNPARQSFVTEMVGPGQVRNAISLTSSVFQLGATVGPAVSGALLSAVGAGWAFVINAASFAAPVVALLLIRDGELIRDGAHPRAGAQLRVGAQPGGGRSPAGARPEPAGRADGGVRRASRTPQVWWPTLLAGVFGLFTINLPVTLAGFARSVFHSGAAGYGLLSSVVAAGSLAGALLSARRGGSRLRSLVGTAAALAGLEMLAAAAPGPWLFAAALVPVGAATLLLLTAANSTVQLAVDGAIRGRILGRYLLVFIGSGALGGPLVGWIDQRWGPRAGLLLAGLVPGMVTCYVAVALARAGQLRLRLVAGPARLRRPQLVLR